MWLAAAVEPLDWGRLLTLYGPALVFSWAAVWALWGAWQRERERGRELSRKLVDSTTEQAKTAAEMTQVLGAANEYLRDLRDQGMRAVTREPRP